MIDALGRAGSVLVLGGGSEIGLAVVDRLVADGCRTVVLAARDPQRLGPDLARLRAAGATTAEAVAFDALDPAAHPGFVEATFDRFGDLDVVVAAFGVLGDQAAFEADPVAAADAVRANYVGAVSSLLAVAARMRAQGHGAIVVLSSVAAERARRSSFVYGSSKAGLDAFAQGLGDSLVGSGVRVLVVRPGFVIGRMTGGLMPAPMATTPVAVADAVARGLRGGAEVVWVPAPLRWLMAALRHLPRALWRKVSANR